MQRHRLGGKCFCILDRSLKTEVREHLEIANFGQIYYDRTRKNIIYTEGGRVMTKVITISREYGAGGHSIGERVAKELGIPFYDKDIMKETAKASGYDLELVREDDEDVSTTNVFLKALTSPAFFNDPQEAIYEVQKAVVCKFAMEGPCVILGRCADVALKEAGIESLDVFIHADDLHRAMRISEITGEKNPKELKKMIQKKDKSRHNYYTHYASKHWGDSRNYTLSLDSGALGYDLCVKLIVEAAQQED